MQALHVLLVSIPNRERDLLRLWLIFVPNHQLLALFQSLIGSVIYWDPCDRCSIPLWKSVSIPNRERDLLRRRDETMFGAVEPFQSLIGSVIYWDFRISMVSWLNSVFQSLIGSVIYWDAAINRSRSPSVKFQSLIGSVIYWDDPHDVSERLVLSSVSIPNRERDLLRLARS